MSDNSSGPVGRRRLLGLAGAAALTATCAALGRAIPRADAEPAGRGTAVRDRHWNRETERIRAGHRELLTRYAENAGGRS